MDTPGDLLLVIVGTAVITAFIIATLLRATYRPPEVIYVPPPVQREEDGGSGCLFIFLMLALFALILFSS